MKNKQIRILILILILLTVMACNLPMRRNTGEESKAVMTPEPTLESWAWYQGEGVKIYLPNSYVMRNISEDLPVIREYLQSFISQNPDSPFIGMLSNLEQNVVFWGLDSMSDSANPNRVAIIKNSEMSLIPLELLTTTLQIVFGEQMQNIEVSNLQLGNYEVVRYVFYQQAFAEAVYMLKADNLLWIITFNDSPSLIDAKLTDFDRSVSSFSITGQ